jgi:hypothetical protein
MAIDDEQAAIRTVIAGVLVGRGNENGRAADALPAIQQAAAIVRALTWRDTKSSGGNEAMARSGFNEPIEPMDLANMRANDPE